MVALGFARSSLFVLVFAVALVLIAAHADNQVKAITFGYSGANGPEKWASLNPEFRACSDGQNQSPIDVLKKNSSGASDTVPIYGDYINPDATLVNNGFNIGIQFSGNVGSIFVNKKKHYLVRMVWHTPSEHVMSGERGAAELHLIHMSDDGDITVVAYVFKYGDQDKFLVEIGDKLAALANEKCDEDHESQIPLGVINMKTFRRQPRKYYTYKGSLTTPPCTENVTWIVIAKVREISNEQVAALQAPLSADYKENSRPIQPMNTRDLYTYDEVFARKIVNAEV